MTDSMYKGIYDDWETAKYTEKWIFSNRGSVLEVWNDVLGYIECMSQWMEQNKNWPNDNKSLINRLNIGGNTKKDFSVNQWMNEWMRWISHS
jgi:hypothetical protein